MLADNNLHHVSTQPIENNGKLKIVFYKQFQKHKETFQHFIIRIFLYMYFIIATKSFDIDTTFLR